MDSFGDTTSSPPPPSATPAGWYPVDDLSQRYWDGAQWTEHMAPRAAQGFMHVAAGPHDAPTSDERTYAMIMHLGGLLFSFLVPLIMWLVKKDQSPFIDHHGKQALNFFLTMLIAGIVSLVLVLFLIGIFMLIALMVVGIVVSILAALAANRGEYYQMPFAIQFVK